MVSSYLFNLILFFRVQSGKISVKIIIMAINNTRQQEPGRVYFKVEKRENGRGGVEIATAINDVTRQQPMQK